MYHAEFDHYHVSNPDVCEKVCKNPSEASLHEIKPMQYDGTAGATSTHHRNKISTFTPKKAFLQYYDYSDDTNLNDVGWRSKLYKEGKWTPQDVWFQFTEKKLVTMITFSAGNYYSDRIKDLMVSKGISNEGPFDSNTPKKIAIIASNDCKTWDELLVQDDLVFTDRETVKKFIIPPTMGTP